MPDPDFSTVVTDFATYEIRMYQLGFDCLSYGAAKTSDRCDADADRCAFPQSFPAATAGCTNTDGCSDNTVPNGIIDTPARCPTTDAATEPVPQPEAQPLSEPQKCESGLCPHSFSMACYKCGQSLDCIVDDLPLQLTSETRQNIIQYLTNGYADNHFCYAKKDAKKEEENLLITPAGQQNCESMAVGFTSEEACCIPHANIGSTECPIRGQALSNFATYTIELKCEANGCVPSHVSHDTEKCDSGDCNIRGSNVEFQDICTHNNPVVCTQNLGTSVRHLNAVFSADEQLGFVSEEMKRAAEPSKDSDEPYCLHADYPCVDSDGEEDGMVHVCHYSTRAGYQTFCIPEVDSDIMRFYTNDYCGPCEGWNGKTNPGQVI
jgi:hypothetical protein